MKDEIENKLRTAESVIFQKSVATYVAGFILSIFLTLFAYYLVVDKGAGISAWTIGYIIAGLALVQFVVQIFFFMHLRVRTKPRWRFVVFFFMILVVLILVGGSVWIMTSLNNRMVMTPDQENQYMQDQIGL